MSTSSLVPGARRRLEIALEGLSDITLFRVLDHELIELGRLLEPIEPNHLFALEVALSCDRLALPKALAAGEHLFGKSSRSFDDFKCSFAFPLMFPVSNAEQTALYLMIFGDRRGSLETVYYRVAEQEQPASRGYRAPVDDEMPRGALDHLSAFLIGYLDGFGETLACRTRDFYRIVECEHLVYGLRSGEFFLRHVEGHEEFWKVVGVIKEDMGSCAARTAMECRTALLDDMLSGRVQNP